MPGPIANVFGGLDEDGPRIVSLKIELVETYKRPRRGACPGGRYEITKLILPVLAFRRRSRPANLFLEK
jgi:hypothetical protein